MATKRRDKGERAGSGVDGRFERLEMAQRDTNERLGRIEETLKVSSHLFELMHERLEHLDRGQQALVEGQKLVVERLDRLVDATVRERTQSLERLARLEQRVETIEQKLGA
jgi:hypothetical protein